MKDKNQVFVVSLAITIIMAIWAVAFNANFTVVSNAAYSFLTNNFGWLYLMAMTAFVIFSIAIAFSKWGKIKLGPDDSKPEYSTVSWFAMLFGAGMGVGLVFWGISEPLAHFSSPIPGIEAGTEAAANFAIRSSYMHWGLHPWANYCIIGLGLAYFQFRKGKPGLISSIFEPLIGEKGINGWVGKTIDVLAVFATVAGVVTSLGLGVMQINAGLNYLFGIPTTLVIQIIIIAVISVIYIWSAVDGISRGIKIISDANLYIAIGLITVTFLVGPKLEILNNLTNGLGQYLGQPHDQQLWRQYLGGSLESVLLGMVDCMGSICGILYCTYLQGQDNSGIYRRRGAGTGPGVHPLVCHYGKPGTAFGYGRYTFRCPAGGYCKQA